MTPSLLLVWLPVLLLGLCLGSFLNVLITRLPVMLMRTWRSEARAALELPAESSSRFDLAVPASICPSCEAPIRWHDNIPLVGWLKRRGRCADCQARISVQYPLVELAGGVLGVTTVAMFGVTAEAAFIFAACLALLALAVIDFRTRLLPDVITLPLLWAGLVYQLLFQPLMLPSAVIGAIAGYLVLWGFYWLFKLVTGKEGMGYGDFKLLAALGAWLGWSFLPLLLVMSAGFGALIGLALQTSPERRGLPMPFGPFLAVAGWAGLLAGNELMAAYLGLMT